MNRKDRIHQQLKEQFAPIHLDVEDESFRHHVPENAQTHFKVTLVSSKFIQKSRIDRHRQVTNLLKQEFDTGLHALSMHLYTPEEWQAKPNPSSSPACRDGYDNK